MKNLIICGLTVFPMLAGAMPSKADLDKVSPVVADLMKPEQDALKEGKKTKTEVADAAIALVAQADGEAAKLLLLKGAFNLYVRDGQFDKALDTLKTMRAEVPDITPQYLANVIETALKRVPRKNARRLYQILDETKTLARYQDELKKLETQAKARPADKAVQTKLAEHYAVLGDWEKSLEHFAKGEDAKAAQVAKDEQGGAKDAKAIADFWWNYPNKRSEEFEKPFKQHAAALYSQAVAAGTLVGLNKVQTERRIEEAKAMGEVVESVLEEPVVKPSVKSGTNSKLYCVIDLSRGPNATRYPVSYLNDVPKGGWTDEYKTTKLVLRKIEPGSFEYLPGKKFTITKPFYIGVFEVTQKQYELVVGNNPAKHQGDMRPVDCISYEMIRGKNKGLSWPQTDEVDYGSFTFAIRSRTGCKFDLPTEVQWEYVRRTGLPGDACPQCGTDDALKYGRYRENGGSVEHSANVGSYMPNAWNVYDLYGNVWELCLDQTTKERIGMNRLNAVPNDTKDYAGEKNGGCCFRRGGSWYSYVKGGPISDCTRGDNTFDHHTHRFCQQWDDTGFRLAIQPPFVPPKK